MTIKRYFDEMAADTIGRITSMSGRLHRGTTVLQESLLWATIRHPPQKLRGGSFLGIFLPLSPGDSF
jgi:hypothetical protein